MIDNEKHIIGEELKYAIAITSSGFDMDIDDWEIELIRGQKSVVLGKSDCVKDIQGKWYFPFDTYGFTPGLVKLIVTAYVNDADFPDGKRTEIDKYDLTYLEKR